MSKEVLAALAGFSIAFIVIGIVLGVLHIIAGWKIFKKAGEKGWKVLIPFYNLYVQYKFSWKPLFFWILLILAIISAVAQNMAGGSSDITVAGIIAIIADIALLVLYIMTLYRLCKCFGHGGGWTVGFIFLPTIFTLMLAFGKSEYKGNIFLKA